MSAEKTEAKIEHAFRVWEGRVGCSFCGGAKERHITPEEEKSIEEAKEVERLAQAKSLKDQAQTLALKLLEVIRTTEIAAPSSLVVSSANPMVYTQETFRIRVQGEALAELRRLAKL